MYIIREGIITLVICIVSMESSIYKPLYSLVPRPSHHPVFICKKKKNRREKSGRIYPLTDINTQEGRKEEEPPIERMQFVHALHVPNKWLVVANIQNSI